MHVYFLQAQEFHLGIPGIHAVCRGHSEEDVRKCTLTKLKEVGSPERIRTSNISVNSREWRKSKCPIWCRLREIGSHFPLSSCTQCCTQDPGDVHRVLHALRRRTTGERRRYRMSPCYFFSHLPSRRLQRGFIAFDRRISVAHAS